MQHSITAGSRDDRMPVQPVLWRPKTMQIDSEQLVVARPVCVTVPIRASAVMTPRSSRGLSRSLITLSCCALAMAASLPRWA
jgi:hypothetical protein